MGSGRRVLDIADGFTSNTAPLTASIIDNTNVTVTDATTFALDANSSIQKLTVTGNGGAVTATSSPFSNAAPDNGIVILMGTSNTNTVEFKFADVAGGLMLDGDVILGKNQGLMLIYKLSEDRYEQISLGFFS